ncbi:MAG: BRCT domain-containing protein [Clostridia bacterium]|nr:BRCT domain-containing protein [Clostridia bacterium]
MLLADSLVEALSYTDLYNKLSGVKVFCEESVRDEAKGCFLTEFEKEWQNALEKAEEEYGELEEDEENIPCEIIDKNYGFFISTDGLDIRHSYGDYFAPDYGIVAFNQALKNLKSTYSQIEYEGYLGFLYSDVSAGEVYQWELSSKEKDDKKIYDFVGEILGEVFASDLYIPEEPLDADGLNFVITGKLNHFENREEISEYIEDLGGSVTSGISKNTNYLINNDINSTSSKNIKATELGVPIISESEFIAMFGDPSEFDIEESDFWRSLEESITGYNDDSAEVTENLYAYSNWIKKADFDRAIRSIAHIVGEEEDNDWDE